MVFKRRKMSITELTVGLNLFKAQNNLSQFNRLKILIEKAKNA